MAVYPLTPSQYTKASKEALLAFIKNPAMVARRLAEILSAQEFLSFFLLQMQGLQVQGGAIAIPHDEKIRTDRGTRTVAPGAEYPLTTMSHEQYEFYQTLKEGLATEVTDEEIGRSLRQPIDDAILFLKTEHVFTQDDSAMAVIKSTVQNDLTATGTWADAKVMWKDAERVQMAVRKMRLGFDIDTAVLPGDLYASLKPELVEIMGKDGGLAATSDFPTIAGITWVPDITGSIDAPLFTDRARLGGIAYEEIPSPEYVKVGTLNQAGGQTHVELQTRRAPGSDKTIIQTRNAVVPVVVNPEAGMWIEGAV